ncbi:MAG: Ig-like domain-containing protein [Actinomycetales bacterium]|nr:Ig-like domain-containing protein [Actinomycetales bacterium]
MCTATVAADGSWTCDPVTALPEGSHTFTASGTDAAGNTTTATTTTVIDVTAPVVTATSPAVTNDTTPTISGTTDLPAGSTITVTEGGVAVCTATVAADGSWTCDPVTALPEGSHTFTASGTDAAGNTTTATTTTVIDVTAPVVSLVIDPVTADNVVNAVEAGGPVSVTGTVSGEFVAGDTVTLTVNGTTYTGVVDAAGKFSIPVPGAELVADPDVTVDGSVSTVDAAGNPGSASDSQLYAVDVTAPVVRGGGGAGGGGDGARGVVGD